MLINRNDNVLFKVLFPLFFLFILQACLRRPHLSYEVATKEVHKIIGYSICDEYGAEVGIYTTYDGNTNQILLNNGTSIKAKYSQHFSANATTQRIAYLESSDNSILIGSYDLKYYDYAGNARPLNNKISYVFVGGDLILTKEGHIFTSGMTCPGKGNPMYYLDQNGSIIWTDTLLTREHIIDSKALKDDHLYLKILASPGIVIQVRSQKSGKIVFQERFVDNFHEKSIQSKDGSLTLFTSNSDRLNINYRQGVYTIEKDSVAIMLTKKAPQSTDWYFLPNSNRYLFFHNNTLKLIDDKGILLDSIGAKDVINSRRYQVVPSVSDKQMVIHTKDKQIKVYVE